MTAPALPRAVDAGGGVAGFPSALFTIEDDPGALTESAARYRPLALQAAATRETLAATRVDSWTGSEGDLFRTRRASYEPMMATAQQVFTAFHTALTTFAADLTTIRSRMAQLRLHAEGVWVRLQSAKTAQAQTTAALASATTTAVASAANPGGAMAAASAMSMAQAAASDAAARASAAQAEWDECVRQADTLHTELRTAADRTAAIIRGLQQPPPVPGASAGGAGDGAATGVASRAGEAVPPNAGNPFLLDITGGPPRLGPGLPTPTPPSTPLPSWDDVTSWAGDGVTRAKDAAQELGTRAYNDVIAPTTNYVGSVGKAAADDPRTVLDLAAGLRTTAHGVQTAVKGVEFAVVTAETGVGVLGGAAVAGLGAAEAGVGVAQTTQAYDKLHRAATASPVTILPPIPAKPPQPLPRGRTLPPEGDDGCHRDANGVPTVVFDRTKAPNIGKNFDDAVAAGHPTQLHRVTDEATKRANRREALKGHPKAPQGQSLDEYPFASSAEGGAGAQVKAVPREEQNYQGGQLGGTLNKCKVGNGDPYNVEFNR